MMMKKILFGLFILIPTISFADASTWKMVPSESSLSFTATQNGAPVTGKFTKFTGDIHFDPKQLDQSHVKIIVDVSSISDAYNQLSDTLKTPEWFNSKVFPQAVFEAKEFSKTGDNTYQAKGKLTIRDKTQPVTLTFTQEEYTATKAKMKGETTIQRTAFGVGQGEWADTKAVKDDVHIDFTVAAVK